MRPLPSTDWPALRSLDRVVDVLAGHLEQLAKDAGQGLELRDYEQLRRNIDWLKSGFEQAERLLIHARERARASRRRRRLGTAGAEQPAGLEERKEGDE